ncbi:N-methyl-L-tryptophan oxidase [Actinoplanes sp. NPDC051494]|uniref:N-methyl-L-tryptophan oxidase n=1 Tax=Actinoplanes sp. NPDC051494 TaxID=3363907 RepID=UPI00378F646C
MTSFPSIRAATPGTRHARHFNAAGAALPSAAMLRTVVEHLNLESRIGGYEAAETAKPRFEAVYSSAARLINARADDIALVESATVGWHRAMDALALTPGSRVLAAASSYVSSAMHLLELRRTHGVVVEVLPCDPSGRTDLEALAKALREPAALVTVAHVPTSSGLVEPVAEIGALTAGAGVPLLLDATQSLGQLPLDVVADHVDIAVGTGRKFLRGPRGTGLLYVSPAMRERMRPSHPDVRGARWHADGAIELDAGARRYETWETSHALRLGLGVALDEALALGVPAIHDYIGSLAGHLRSVLGGLPGVRLTDPPASTGGIVTFVLDGEEPRDTVLRLRAAGVHLTQVPAGHGQWDLGRRGLDAVVRASVHVYNDESDVDALAETLVVRRGAPAFVRSDSHADVIVVGAGIHGSAAAWQLARRGVRVTHLDRFPDGHTEGSSHGHTRMIRRAYPSAFWDGLVDRAYAAWDELSTATGTPLVTTTGGLYARADGVQGLRGPGCRTVGDHEAAGIFPGLRLEPGWSALYDPAAGVIDAAAALAGLRELALAHGADRRPGTAVASWRPDGAGVRVTTSAGELTADRLVVCAGPWTSQLLPQFAPLLEVTRIINVFLGARDGELVAPPGLGVFSIDVPDVGLLFGLPAFGGSALKVGLEPGPASDPSVPQHPPTAGEIARLVGLARRFLPGVDGSVVDTVACRYTMAPRNRFAIGELPGTPQVSVAAACSGHGFKFGPAIGAALADIATGIARPDLDGLSPAALGVTG